MHTILFVGTSGEIRNTHIDRTITDWGIVPVDVIRLSQEETIGIDAIREFKKRLLLTPYQSPYTAGVLHNMHLLTPEAQNALLKLLEEPPPHAKILGETPVLDTLLPTIISRCQIIHTGKTTNQITEEEQSAYLATIQQLIQASPGKKLQLIEQIGKTREEFKKWVDNAIITTRTMLTSQPSGETASLARRLLKAKAMLDANVTPKLVVDVVFLPETSGSSTH